MKIKNKMKKVVYSLLLITNLIACNTSQNDAAKIDALKADSIATNSVNKTIESCYLFAQNKDTTTVNLAINSNKISGKMHWNPWQKDGAIGNLTGTKNCIT